MKKFFKQLFCKHEWKTSSNSLSIEDFNTHKNTVVSEIHKVCKKCGKQIIMAIALFLVCTLSFTSCGVHISSKSQTEYIRKILIGDSNNYFWYYDGVGPNITTHARIFKFLDNDKIIELTIGWPGDSCNCIYYGIQDELPIKDYKIHEYKIQTITTPFEDVFENYILIDGKMYDLKVSNNKRHFTYNSYGFELNTEDYYKYPTIKLFIDKLVSENK